MSTHAFRIPASTSNLGPGFDAVGFALEIYLRVEVELLGDGAELRVEADGVDSDKIPSGEDNLMVQVIRDVGDRRDRGVPAANLRVRNEIPLTRGLGSSAAAIIAGVTCYEILSGERFNVDEIFEYARPFESHPDNLAAALMGGLVVSAGTGAGKTVFSRVEVPEGAVPVVVIPEFELSTEKARGVLPGEYSREDVGFNIQRSALIIAAITGGNWKLLSEAMRDRIHQPYRAPLIPGLEEVLALQSPGLFGIALSGAGPTVLALAAPENAARIGQNILDVFARNNVPAETRLTKMDTHGRFSETMSLGFESNKQTVVQEP